MKDNLKIIQELHKTDFKFVIVSSGGGSNAVGTLLKVPGASNSVLELTLKNHWFFIFLENEIFTALKLQLCVWQQELIVPLKK